MVSSTAPEKRRGVKKKSSIYKGLTNLPYRWRVRISMASIYSTQYGKFIEPSIYKGFAFTYHTYRCTQENEQMYEKIRELMVYCWELSKKMFEEPNDFKKMYQIANEGVKNTPNANAQKFVKAMLLAMLEFIEDEWRENEKKH